MDEVVVFTVPSEMATEGAIEYVEKRLEARWEEMVCGAGAVSWRLTIGLDWQHW